MSTGDDFANFQKTISQLMEALKDSFESLDECINNSDKPDDEKVCGTIIGNIQTLINARDSAISSFMTASKLSSEGASADKYLDAQLKDIINTSQTTIAQYEQQIAALNQEKYNKLRLIEINNYYGLKYSNHKKIIFSIVVICVIFLITIILKNKKIISENIFFYFNVVYISVSIIYIYYTVSDSNRRDTRNFDEYDFNFNYNDAIKSYPVQTPPDQTRPPVNVNGLSACPPPQPSESCSGNSCCGENMTFDSKQNICVMNANTLVVENVGNSYNKDELYVIDYKNSGAVAV